LAPLEADGVGVGGGAGDVADGSGAEAVVLGVVNAVDRFVHRGAGVGGGEGDVGVDAAGADVAGARGEAWRYQGRLGPPAERT
jgi:hypothetical protein